MGSMTSTTNTARVPYSPPVMGMPAQMAAAWCRLRYAADVAARAVERRQRP